MPAGPRSPGRYAPGQQIHIPASLFINDDESGLYHDFDVWLEKLAPHEPVSMAQRLRGQCRRRLIRQVMGREVVVAVTDSPAATEAGTVPAEEMGSDPDFIPRQGY